MATIVAESVSVSAPPPSAPNSSSKTANNKHNNNNNISSRVGGGVGQQQAGVSAYPRRPPRIGQLPRHGAFDEDDLIARKNQTNAKNNVAKAKAAKDHFYLVQSHEDGGGLSSETASNGDCELSPTSTSASTTSSSSGSASSSSTEPCATMAQAAALQHQHKGNGSRQHAAAGSTTKGGAMIGSFTSVIEKGTRELSLADGGQRNNSVRSSPSSHNSSRAGSQDGGSVCGSPPAVPQHNRAPPPPALVALNPQTQVPIPTKCSAQLRRLIHSHSLTQPPSPIAKNSPCCTANSSSSSLASGGSSSLHFGATVAATDPNCPPSSAPANPNAATDGRPIFPNLPYSPYGSPTSSPRVRRKPLRETKRVDSITEPGGEYTQLNQYKLKDSIGQGSYGIVKLAYNKEDDSHYAMKILSKKKLKRRAGIFGRGLPNRKAPGGADRKMAEDPLQKVYREIAIMKKLDHPNVVRLFEVLDDPEDDNLYMVFELLEGGEVLQVPTETPMDEKAAWLAFRDVLLGMEYLHYQKIIHRDIKPSNLLRTPSGLVKMADLGVSNEFDGADAYLTNTAGTPAFTPPESISHKPGDDPWLGKAADIWSLGVTLYALVTGRVPFHDDNVVSLYNKIRTGEFVFPEDKDISPELQDLIKRMLVKDPAQRITLPEIKVHDWVTGFGLYPLASEEENCVLVEVTEKEVDDSVRSVPKLDTLILVKSMMKNHSFKNPFLASIKDRFQSAGRSNSAPEVQFYDGDRKILESSLPVLSEEEKTEHSEA